MNVFIYHLWNPIFIFFYFPTTKAQLSMVGLIERGSRWVYDFVIHIICSMWNFILYLVGNNQSPIGYDRIIIDHRFRIINEKFIGSWEVWNFDTLYNPLFKIVIKLIFYTSLTIIKAQLSMVGFKDLLRNHKEEIDGFVS